MSSNDRGPYYRGVLAPAPENFVLGLLAAGAPDAIALIEGERRVSYADLGQLVEERAEKLALSHRSLVVLATSNTIEFVVTYLALINDGHVPLLAGAHVERLAAAWQPDAVVETSAGGVRVERSPSAGHELHPDLALLLSTSGSTGDPKLVRLSHGNLLGNARSIAEYLSLSERDRGVTSLPLHYCYGLSVVHSHLLAGAGIVFTDASVIDPCFAGALREHGVTNVAGVPHSFELLEHAGPESIHVPSLRFLTQAGGRLPAEDVTRWVERAAGWGVDFYVMYGQTEATARMAYLPPELAAQRPSAIGVPIPGGRLEVRPVEGLPADVGELVYHGPNVMMGYATTPADLANGATLDELHTGDLGRFDPELGVFEIVGRQSRFVKPFGLRVDLDAVEAEARTVAPEAAVTGDDHRVVVWAPGADAERVRQTVAGFAGLPPGAVGVATDLPIPRTGAGKVDYAAILAVDAARRSDESAVAEGDQPGNVAAIFGLVLGRPDVTPDSTFVSLGGDSLSYVECSIRLERRLGRLPADWHLRPVAELETAATPTRVPRLDTTVVLRAVGICAIVATHMSLWYFPGGAHLMLAVVGYNLSRFQLPIPGARARVAAGLRTVGRVAVPTVAFVGICMLLVGGYSIPTLLLVHGYAGIPDHVDGRWHYWFVEVFAYLVVIATLLLAIPQVRRLERRAQYLFPLVLFAALLLFRYRVFVIDGATNARFKAHGVAWFFALGWLIHQSTTRWKQLLTSALCLVTIPGAFDRPQREWFILVGLLALIWVKEVPLPRLAIWPVATVAAASMWILISHFRVFPPLTRNLPIGVAFALTIVAGVLVWRLSEHLGRWGSRQLAARRNRPPAPVARPVQARPAAVASLGNIG